MSVIVLSAWCNLKPVYFMSLQDSKATTGLVTVNEVSVPSHMAPNVLVSIVPPPSGVKKSFMPTTSSGLFFLDILNFERE